MKNKFFYIIDAIDKKWSIVLHRNKMFFSDGDEKDMTNDIKEPLLSLQGYFQ